MSYTWIPFYEELAKKMLLFKDESRWTDLVEKVEQVCANFGGEQTVVQTNKKNGIDPFTVYALFNRKQNDETRIKWCESIKEVLDLKSPVPSDFAGIPTHENRNAGFRRSDDDYSQNEARQDLLCLWNIFAFVQYKTLDEINEEDFIKAFNAAIHVKQTGLPKLTIGLFQASPKLFVPLDDNSWLSVQGVLEQYKTEKKEKIFGKDYLTICKELKKKRYDENNGFAEFSFDSWDNASPRVASNWIIFGRREDFRHQDCFKELGHIDWDIYRAGIKKGDNVYIYYTDGNEKYIRYWTVVEKADLKQADVKQEKYWDNKEYDHNAKAKIYRLSLNKELSHTFAEKMTREYLKSRFNFDLPSGGKKEVKDNNVLLFMEKMFAQSVNSDGDTNVKSQEHINQNEYSKHVICSYNIILHGAPGTGKTYLAKQIATDIVSDGMCKDYNELTDEQKKRIGFVQFHPSYDYTDFVEGLRPVKKDNGSGIVFDLKSGIFKEFVDDARNENEKTNKYVFIIDEINRGEISKIFGELFFSIDPGYRGKKEDGVLTQYSNLHTDREEKFFIPENVYIIGTMNDIDRSVDTFDFAMRRRFRFIEVTAEARADDILSDLSKDDKDEAKRRMSRLNNEIVKIAGLNANYHIGPAYFLNCKNITTDGKDKWETLWEDYLEPLLYEYVRGMENETQLIKDLKDAYDGKSDEPISGGSNGQDQ